jgi:hypothetical protein
MSFQPELFNMTITHNTLIREHGKQDVHTHIPDRVSQNLSLDLRAGKITQFKANTGELWCFLINPS